MTEENERRYRELNIWADMQATMKSHLTRKAEALIDIPIKDKAREIAVLNVGRYKCLIEIEKSVHEQMLMLGAKP
jgi:hypothetical protein